MSVKQKNAANARKEAMKTVYVARLVDNPTSQDQNYGQRHSWQERRLRYECVEVLSQRGI